MQFLRIKFLNIFTRESHGNPRYFLWVGILIFLSVLLMHASPREAKGLLIKNGLIVTVENCYEADILIKEEKIIEIGPHLSTEAPGIVTIDASGLQILPGGIDPHVHLADSWADDFTSGSKAALAGGITTIGHMSWPQEDETLTDLLKRFMLLAGKTSIADFFFHPFIVDLSQAVLAEIPEIKRKGHTTLKIYMAMDEFDRNIPGFVALTSTNAAKLFGLYPRKGTIAVGSDADLVLWNPNDSYTFGETTKFSKSDFSIFDEWRITGRPVTTIRRGEVVFHKDMIKGKAGSGKFIPRSSPKKLCY